MMEEFQESELNMEEFQESKLMMEEFQKFKLKMEKFPEIKLTMEEFQQLKLINLEPQGCKEPSFEKATNLPRMINPAANPHDNAQNSFIVRPTTCSSQENLDENKVKIPEEVAVCRYCSTLLKEEDVVWMKCQCKIPLGLVHDACKLKWSEENGKYNCPGCGTEPETVPAQLVKVTDSATLEEKKRKKMNIFSRFKRM